MKFITICVTVCAIALNLSFDFVNSQAHRATIGNKLLNQSNGYTHTFSPVRAEDNFIRHPQIPSGPLSRRVYVYRGGQNFPLASFEDEMYRQFDIAVARTVVPYMDCSANVSLVNFTGLDLYKNDKDSYMQTPLLYAKERKWLVDCAMRKLGVITDAGLNETEYMLQIKQLRLNYTSFDINEKPNELKPMMLNTFRNATLDFAAKDDCHIIFNPSRRFNNKEYLCYELVGSYALAARNCKDLKDPAGDKCETSWMILTCMNEDHRKRHFKAPLFPIPLFEGSYNGSESAVNSTGLD